MLLRRPRVNWGALERVLSLFYFRRRAPHFQSCKRFRRQAPVRVVSAILPRAARASRLSVLESQEPPAVAACRLVRDRAAASLHHHLKRKAYNVCHTIIQSHNDLERHRANRQRSCDSKRERPIGARPAQPRVRHCGFAALSSQSQSLAARLAAIKLPATKSRRKSDQVDLNWALEQATDKVIHAHQYVSILASFVEPRDADAAEKLRAVARVLA
jgi:hypothetical protein